MEDWEKKKDKAKASCDSIAVDVEGGIGKLEFNIVKGGDSVTVFIEGKLTLTEDARDRKSVV